MPSQSYHRQLGAVIIIELVLLLVGYLIADIFWDQICDRTVISCLADKELSLATFLVLSFFRPFVFTPLTVFSLMAGNAFGPTLGAVVGAIGATLSCAAVYILAKAVGKKLVNPWLSTNLPQTLHFIRSQDWKVVLACRLIPILPFDILTFAFGVLDFRWRWVMLATLLGILPEAYIFAEIATPDSTLLSSTLTTLAVICIFCLLPGLVVEFLSRKKGSSLWVRLKAMWRELNDEIRLNNDIVKRKQHDPEKIPILLLYGFFSSRRALTVLERILTRRGYEVISFNLGGLLGVFFTRSIPDTAQFIDYKLKRQFERHNFEHINIVAHSKGGLVALWWLLKLGGHRHCKKLITMGTPYRGTFLTWLALVTPAGLLFRDLWQMRPGSSLLKELKATSMPPGIKVYNLYSNRDRVATGKNGLFKPYQASEQIIPIPMHHVTHFEFLYRRDVGDTLVSLLGSPYLREQDEVEPKKDADAAALAALAERPSA